MFTRSSSQVIASLFFGAVVFSGCGSTDALPVPIGRDDRDGASIAHEEGVAGTDYRTGDSVALGDDVPIPASFPQDFPKYPGARTQVALHSAEERSYTVNQQTGDSVAQIKAWAENGMTAAGFTKISEIADTSVSVLTYEKGAIRYRIQAARDEARSLTYLIVVRIGG